MANQRNTESTQKVKGRSGRIIKPICKRLYFKNCLSCKHSANPTECLDFEELHFKELKKIYASNIRKHNFIAFDVENNPKPEEDENFICSSIYGEIPGKNEPLIIDESYTNIDDFQEDLAYYAGKPNVISLAYNMGYDQSFTREIVNDSGSLITESRFIQLKFKKGEARTFNGRKIKCNGGKCWDIQNISGTEYTLEHWMKVLRELPKYQKYNLKKYELTSEQLIKRNRFDSIATWCLGDFVQDYFADDWQTRLKMTIGSNALEIYQTHYLERTIRKPFDDIIDSFERLSYRGGRNEIFRRGLINVLSYDVHSMYVYIMSKHLFPMPDSVVYIENPSQLEKDWRYYFDNFLGIYDVQIEIPEMYVCPLPVKAKINGMEKIIYPYGNFRGVYTNAELKAAESYGCKITKCYRFTYYYKSSTMFKNFALDIWERRKKHKKTNEAMDIMDKKTGNSCYGKFGQRIFEYSYSGRISDLPDNITEKINNGVLTPYYTEYNDEGYVFVNSPDKKDSKHTFPCIASFVTSYARIKWLERAKQVEKYIVYGDTDSVKYESNEITKFEDEPDLGGFGFEYNENDIFFAPKNYMDEERFIELLQTNEILTDKIKENMTQKEINQIIEDANNSASKSKIKIKGIPKRAKLSKMDIDNGIMTFVYEAPNKYKSSIRRNKEMAKWERISKDVAMNDDKRIWYGDVFFNQGTQSKAYEINTKTLDTIEIKI